MGIFKKFLKTPWKTAVFIACILAASAITGFVTFGITIRSAGKLLTREKYVYGYDAQGVKAQKDVKGQQQFVNPAAPAQNSSAAQDPVMVQNSSAAQGSAAVQNPSAAQGSAAVQNPSAAQDSAAVQSPSAAQDPAAPAQSPAYISADKAKDTALRDAGLAAKDVYFTKAEQDYENGILVYDIEFYTSSHEYDYEIYASTGAIYSKSSELLMDGIGHGHGSAAGTGSAGNAGNATGFIGTENAKSIALKHAGAAASDVHFKKAELEHDQGYNAYDIEFYRGGIEYEYKIDAANGTILECEIG